MTEISINCDVGEGVENEAQLMPYIQSCNIACGGHAGTKETIAQVVALALQHSVAIGAHPSYPDTQNFGRVSLPIKGEILIKSIQQQISLLEEVLAEKGGVLHHIKPHGALYNDVAANEKLAIIFLEAIKKYKKSTVIYVPYQSVIAKKATQSGFTICYEAFADRAYNSDLSLVSRKLPNAVLTNKALILAQVLHIVKAKSVVTVQNQKIPLKASTFCVHSDTKNAVEIVKYLYEHKQIMSVG